MATSLLHSDYSNKVLNPNFCQNSVKESGVKGNETSDVNDNQPDTFVKKVDKEINKKSTKIALSTGFGVLLLSGFALIFNPKFSPKILNKTKILQQKALNKVETTKNNVVASKFYQKVVSMFKKFHDILEFSNNINSIKDICYKKLCGQKLEFNSVKNKTGRKILQKIQSAVVYIAKKPNEWITKTFDKISINTVKGHYKRLNKQMKKLDDLVKLNRENLSSSDRIRLDQLLSELEKRKQYFSEGELLKRLKAQENGMANLETDVLKRFEEWRHGFRNPIHIRENYNHINSNFNFWAYDSLIDFRNVLEKEGQDAIASLIGKEGSTKGIYQEIFDILSKAEKVTPENKTMFSRALGKLNKKLLKANDIETVQYFDKKRDLVLGSAPTDVLTNFSMLALSLGLLAASNSKEERRTRTMTGVFPIVGGIGTNLLFTAKLYSGATGMLMGAGSSVVLSKLGSTSNKLLFGTDIDENPKEKAVNSEVQSA